MRIMVCCCAGLGNKINNLINLYHLQEKYKNSAEYYIEWVPDNHCDVNIHDVIDVKRTFEYNVTVFNSREFGNRVKYCNNVRWASTSSKEKTVWDDFDNWSKFNTVVSTSFTIFRFCAIDTVRYFLQERLKWSAHVNELVEKNKSIYNITDKTIGVHLRFGDLFEVVKQGVEDSSKVDDVKDRHHECVQMINTDFERSSEQIFLCSDSKELVQQATISNNKIIKRDDNIEYPKQIDKIRISRSHKSVIDSCVDLILLSRINLRMFMPYSTFSIIAFLMNKQCNNVQFKIHGNECSPKIVKINYE
ncbi:hypothetical protein YASMINEVIRUS_600 [Yasminevirus sp. GU-2018]|uniref:Uncharacterized protein n=1 Tax=Yasminevirus sp. GU-2018 TaxID=2420051 RepID=A0A5K0U8E0_9VIRU|nr:hypothetical protein YASMINEVIRUS_600 [Yasminevirus sp. GU-2018]